MGAAVDDFITEHSRQWAGKTIGQNRAYLNILVEYFGPDRLRATITKQDASEVKKVLQALPAKRHDDSLVPSTASVTSDSFIALPATRRSLGSLRFSFRREREKAVTVWPPSRALSAQPGS